MDGPPLAIALPQVQSRIRTAFVRQAHERGPGLAEPHAWPFALPVVTLKDLQAVRVAEVRLGQVKNDVLRRVTDLLPHGQAAFRSDDVELYRPTYGQPGGPADSWTVAPGADITAIPRCAVIQALPRSRAAERPKVVSAADAGAYDVRDGPGHRPRVITKAVGDRGGGSTMGRPRP